MQRRRERNQKYMVAYRKKRADEGICVRCKDPAAPGKDLCLPHYKERQAYDLAYKRL